MPLRRSCLFLLLSASLASAAEPVDFSRDIRPILSKNCFACHGPDGAQRKTKMRLDHRDSVLRKLGSGNAAVVPGAPEKSELYLRITAKDETEHMPPPETGTELTPAQIALLKRWIGEG